MEIDAFPFPPGKYDGVHPCLTGATTAGKVFVHDPHHRSVGAAGGGGGGGTSRLSNSATDSDLNLLSINQAVSAVAAGPLQLAGPGAGSLII